MNTTLISAAAATLLATLAVAAPASAQLTPATATAIARFAQDADGQDDRVGLRTTVTASSRSATFDGVQSRFDLDYDAQRDRRESRGLGRVAPGTESASMILDRIRAEGLEDE